jgi:hypothetical protein
VPCHKALQCFPVPLTHSLDQLERGLHSGREALPGGSPGESGSLGIRISDERVRQFRDSTPSDTEANVRSRAGRPATLRNGAVRISPPGREHTPDANVRIAVTRDLMPLLLPVPSSRAGARWRRRLIGAPEAPSVSKMSPRRRETAGEWRERQCTLRDG